MAFPNVLSGPAACRAFIIERLDEFVQELEEIARKRVNRHELREFYRTVRATYFNVLPSGSDEEGGPERKPGRAGGSNSLAVTTIRMTMTMARGSLARQPERELLHQEAARLRRRLDRALTNLPFA